MTLNEYEDYVAYSRQHFEEGLIRAGFTEKDKGWLGTIVHAAGATEVLIKLLSRFPFQPPRVMPHNSDEVAWSWHRELDGALCLVAEDDHEGLWWTDAPAYLEHVSAWFEKAAVGWADDRPDLDLDRYFNASDDVRLYLYDDLTRYPSGFVRFRPGAHNTMRISGGTRPTKLSKQSKERFGFVTHIGEVDVPPRSWNDIAARINPSIDIKRRIFDYTIEIVVLIYNRGAHEGAIVLEVWPTVEGSIAARRLKSGADTDAAKSARSGLLASDLLGRRVAVVGVGALGSFVADMLARSGVHRLTLLDSDVVMPGNIVRHLVGPEFVGLSKVKAVKQHLINRSGISAADITVIDHTLSSGAEAVELLSEHDLVVNATADFTTTALLHVTARALSKNLLSAVIQNSGTSFRIDLLPPLDGAEPLPPSSKIVNQSEPELFEAGCGSPISPTPPYAVIEAAAATVRHAVGLLVNRPLHPSGETRDLSLGAVRNHE